MSFSLATSSHIILVDFIPLVEVIQERLIFSCWADFGMLGCRELDDNGRLGGRIGCSGPENLRVHLLHVNTMVLGDVLQVGKQNVEALIGVLDHVLSDRNHIGLIGDGVDRFYLINRNRCSWIQIGLRYGGPQNLRVHLFHVDTVILGDVLQAMKENAILDHVISDGDHGVCLVRDGVGGFYHVDKNR